LIMALLTTSITGNMPKAGWAWSLLVTGTGSGSFTRIDGGCESGIVGRERRTSADIDGLSGFFVEQAGNNVIES